MISTAVAPPSERSSYPQPTRNRHTAAPIMNKDQTAPRSGSHGMANRHAIIVGGGASGVLLAYQLLRRGGAAFRVTVIERRSEVGRGVAYHTGNPDHVLNVRAGNMSALPEDPDHFVRWLAGRDICG